MRLFFTDIAHQKWKFYVIQVWLIPEDHFHLKLGHIPTLAVTCRPLGLAFAVSAEKMPSQCVSRC